MGALHFECYALLKAGFTSLHTCDALKPTCCSGAGCFGMLLSESPDRGKTNLGELGTIFKKSKNVAERRFGVMN